MENRFLEQLPIKNCPPESVAHQVQVEMVVYRLVDRNPPTINDFRATSHTQPLKETSGACKSRAISVWSNYEDCSNLRKLSAHRKNQKVCRVMLNKDAGYIERIDSNPHINWWIFKNYPILDFCEMIEKNE